MKIIVAHPEQQHSYRLASALKKAGVLDKYITTVYLKRGNITYIVAHFLPAKYRMRALSRHCNDLDDCDVIQFCECCGLIKLLCSYVPFLKKHYQIMRTKTADRFACKVADYAIKHKIDAVITYDNCSPKLFEELQLKAPNIIRILDMSAANLQYMKEIYENDFILAPDFKDQLQRERAHIWDSGYMKRIAKEIEFSQYFLVPSRFVQRSLSYSGVSDSQMLYCPYGVDIKQFMAKDSMDMKRKEPVKFIYIGGLKELKGIYYLMKAFMNIPLDKAVLTIVGDFDTNSPYVKEYLSHLNIVGRVAHNEISDLIRAHDVFILPSLGEGLSLSAIEAAASCLPLIVTENSGINDFITDGLEGFVIPIQSDKALYDSINWFIEHTDQIESMGFAARKITNELSWEKYDERIRSIVNYLNICRKVV